MPRASERALASFAQPESRSKSEPNNQNLNLVGGGRKLCTHFKLAFVPFCSFYLITMPEDSQLQQPRRTAVDREAVKTLCVAVGVRKAARQLGLPESTVKSWSTRGKWFLQPPCVQQPPTVTKVLQPLASSASTPSNSLANLLADDSKQTRIGLSTAARKAATRFAGRTGDQIIKDSQALRHVAAVASSVHGWDENKGGGLNLQLGVFLGAIE